MRSTHVPYYRQAFADAGAAPDDIRTTHDLARLPTLDKPTLRERRDELLATNVAPSDRYYFTTGGSTGIPVGFYHDLDQPWREWAFIAISGGGSGTASARRASCCGAAWFRAAGSGSAIRFAPHWSSPRTT